TEVEIARMRTRLRALDDESARLDVEVERLDAELPAAESALRAAEERLHGLAATGRPLEENLEAAKDALVDSLAEEARLRNVAEALRQRREDLDGRRRKLEDEQRALGERLHGNAEASEA